MNDKIPVDIPGIDCKVVDRHIQAVVAEAEHRYGVAPSENAGWWMIQEFNRIGDIHGVVIRVMNGEIVYQKRQPL